MSVGIDVAMPDVNWYRLHVQHSVDASANDGQIYSALNIFVIHISYPLIIFMRVDYLSR